MRDVLKRTNVYESVYQLTYPSFAVEQIVFRVRASDVFVVLLHHTCAAVLKKAQKHNDLKSDGALRHRE